MNVEELKLILETISELGGDAREFGIWYLITYAVPSLVKAILLFAFGVIVTRVVYCGICRICNSCVSWFATLSRKIAAAIGVRVYSGWDNSDTLRVYERIEELLKKEKELDGRT